MLARAHRCGVCGWRGEDDVCQRCGTVLLRGRAFCRRCGKVFDGPLAKCDSCGGSVETPKIPDAPETIERLMHLPGVDRAIARNLMSRGFTDPADVLRLALPARAVRLGLHRSLARKLALQELRPAPQIRKFVTCDVCGFRRGANAGECPACGSRGERTAETEQVQRVLEEAVGDVYDLSANPDFRGMPEEAREEILDAFEEAGIDLSFGNEYADQFRQWQAKGIDTQELERILREEGPAAFEGRFVRILRSQLLKRRGRGRFACPLCDEDIPANADECGNCGAKFG